MLPFELDGRQQPVSGVLPGGVVEHLDVIEHIAARLIPCAVGLSPDPFALEQIAEALSDGFAVAVAAAALPEEAQRLGLSLPILFELGEIDSFCRELSCRSLQHWITDRIWEDAFCLI